MVSTIFSDTILYEFIVSPMRATCPPSHSPKFHNPKNILWIVQIMALLIWICDVHLQFVGFLCMHALLDKVFRRYVHVGVFSSYTYKCTSIVHLKVTYQTSTYTEVYVCFLVFRCNKTVCPSLLKLLTEIRKDYMYVHWCAGFWCTDLQNERKAMCLWSSAAFIRLMFFRK
jgi:hypothetical protein